MRIAILIAFGFVACADPNAGRFDRIEQEIRQLRAEVARNAEDNAELSKWRSLAHCSAIHNLDFAAETQFPNRVSFEVGRTQLAPGDRIDIDEVTGTLDHFEVNGIYRVRGRYTFQSADESTINFRVQGGCTIGNPRNRQVIKRGSGSFELATPIAYKGKLHLQLESGEGKRDGNVFFGKDDFLYR